MTIYADRQEVDFGKRIHCDVGHYPLKRHKDFVVLEVVDRLLSNSYEPEEIQVSEDAILTARGETIRCEAWEDYPTAKAQSDNCGMLYTSRLVSGLLECRGMQKGIPFGSGANPPLCKASSDFLIDGDELVQYKGADEIVTVPKGIVSIGASAFWNNTHVKEVILSRHEKAHSTQDSRYSKALQLPAGIRSCEG